MVSNIFYFHPYLGKISNLTDHFQMGWFNHHLRDAFPTFFQASKSSKIYAYSDSIRDGLSHVFLNKQNWVETTKSAWNLKHPRIQMIVSMGWFQIFTWKMVVSQNPSIQNMVVSRIGNSLFPGAFWCSFQLRIWAPKVLQLNPITDSHGTNGIFTSNLVGFLCPRHPVISSAWLGCPITSSA